MKRIFLLGLMSIIAFSYAYPQFTLSGKVSDKQGNPVAFAHVILKDTYLGSFTGNDGVFSLKNLKKGNYIIEVSFIGYKKVVQNIELNKDVNLSLTLEEASFLSDEVTVQANALSAKSPVAYSDINRAKIGSDNSGQDITYMMSLTPSMVVSSDAGTGIGYTGISIRGTDVKRINVCVNGISLNDPESHGVFWVNMPDFASSVQNIQVQRGVGTSTNGAGAFGATINMQSNVLNKDPYAEISSSAGSFSSFKNTVSFGTGLIKEHFTLDARMSKITSDGFIDRAFSDLKSFYVSGGWYSKAGVFKVIVFSGKEITYQAWNGVPKVRLENDSAGMTRYYDHWLYSKDEYDQMLNSGSRTYNYYTYKNEVDNYQQDHYQLHYSKELGAGWFLNSSLHYTYGRGYFEGYKAGKDFADYGLNNYNDSVTSSDFITQKWLDNDFYGGLFSVRYVKSGLDIVAGGGYNIYKGKHFGDIIWAGIVTFPGTSYRWYNGTGDKSDLNGFVKGSYQINPFVNIYADLQIRSIKYEIGGNDDDMRDVSSSHDYTFINPKAGITINPTENQKIYFSYGTANREPSRSDFTDADSGKVPVPERLMDYETGYIYTTSHFFVGINIYYMNYKDQSILTGQINNVGAPVMVNVPQSYRNGFEIEGGVKVSEGIELAANCAVSSNKIKNYTEYVEDWDNGGLVTKSLGTSDISFSPGLVSGAALKIIPFKGMTAELHTKYVSSQYIDNTSSPDRSLDPYFTSDLIITYGISPKWANRLELQSKVVNLFNEEYETNAWVYRYIYGGSEYTMDGYFPQAGRNFMGGITMKF